MRHYWPHPSQDRLNRGVSLIEVVVVLAIAGILMSLGLAAIQRSRETARQIECKNHLRQVGLAINSYAEAFGVFPANHYGLVAINGSAMRVDDYSAHVRLLPYYGNTAAYKSVDFGRNLNDPDLIGTVAGMPLLRCSADPRAIGSNASYFFSIGTVPIPHPSLARSGAFPASVGLSPASIRDGMSNTVGVAEKLCGSGRDFDPIRDAVHVTSPASPIDEASAEFWITTCQSVTAFSSFNGVRGTPWAIGSRMIYNHILPPNSPVIDCGEATTVPMIGINTSRSFHDGAVNVMRMDGSAGTISNSVDLRIWWALGTRAGNE